MSKTFFVGLFGAARFNHIFKTSSSSNDPPYPEGPAYSIYKHYRPVYEPAPKPEPITVCKPAVKPVDNSVYRAKAYPYGFKPRASQPTTSTTPYYREIRPKQQSSSRYIPEIRPQQRTTSRYIPEMRPGQPTTSRYIPEIRPQQSTAPRPYVEIGPQQQPSSRHIPEIRPTQQQYPSQCYRDMWPKQPRSRILQEVRPEGFNFGDNWKRAQACY